MQKEIVKGAPNAAVSVEVVWISMLPTDTEESARNSARMFRDPRIRQFYDGDRRLGIAYVKDVFPDCIRDALTVLPADHELRPRLEEVAASPDQEFALWDAVFAYPPDSEWRESVPKPSSWSKQVDFRRPEKVGKPTGTFWRDLCTQLPIESDWAIEVRTMLGNAKQER